MRHPATLAGAVAVALLPALLLPAAAGTAAGAEPALTSPAAVGPARPSAPITARVAEHPEPPPVDMDLLPDGTPGALPGVRLGTACASTLKRLDPPATAPMLWGQRLFRLPELWRGAGSKGDGIRLAVIDTGVNQHQLLAGRLIAGGDFVTGGNGLSDCDGHGTAVAGIAAAGLDRATGFAGVAPAADVISIRQSSPSYTATDAEDRQVSAGDTNTLAEAIVRAVELRASVINISEVNCSPPLTRPSALQAALAYARSRDVVVVAAAGNTGTGDPHDCPQEPDTSTVVLPGWYDDDVLTVGAVGENGLPTGFSYPGPWVDVAAPGQRLASLAVGGVGVTDQLNTVTSGGQARPGYIDGTSFAAPAVAGLAVLIRARYPDLNAQQVVDRITATASNPGHRDARAGYGLVNPLAALVQQPEVLAPPTASTEGTGTLALSPAPPPNRGRQGALWAGILALLAVVATGILAVGKGRSNQPPHRRR
jgi:membrane-anchored mycosin MYCP